MHYTALVPYSVTAGCSLTSQHSRSTACASLSDHGYLLIQAFFQALQSYSWGFALIQPLSDPLQTMPLESTFCDHKFALPMREDSLQKRPLDLSICVADSPKDRSGSYYSTKTGKPGKTWLLRAKPSGLSTSKSER